MAVKKTNQNTSYTTSDGRKVTIRNGVKTYSGGSTTSSTGTKPSSSSGGSSSSSGATRANQAAQLESMKQSLLKMSADITAGKVTGLSPSAPKTGGGSPTTPNANTINAGYAAALKAAQPIASTATASPASTGSTYTVKSGDTLSQIAARSGTSLSSILASNPQYAANPNLIRPGETIRLNTAGSIPSTAVTNPTTANDLEARRAELEAIRQGVLNVQDVFNEIYGYTDKPFMEENKVTNYEKIIADYTMGRQEPSETQRNYDKTMGKMTNFADSYWKDRDKNINKAYDEFDVEEKNDNLGRVQKDMAEREIKMREDLRKMETAPEYRGVSREFAVDYAQSVREQGAFDLANLAILESAYRGDAERAEKLAQNLIDSQYDQYKGQIEVYQMKLKALEPQLDREQKQQALQLELALDQREKEITDAKTNRELIQDYAITAATAGADPDVYRSILASKSADEAFMLAAPYMKETPKASGGTSGGGVTSIGNEGFSNDVASILSGMQSLDALTPTARQKAINELNAKGFNKATPPSWFSKQTAEQLLGKPITQQMLEDHFKKNYEPSLLPGNMEKDIPTYLAYLWGELRTYIFGTSDSSSFLTPTTGGTTGATTSGGSDLDARINAITD